MPRLLVLVLVGFTAVSCSTATLPRPWERPATGSEDDPEARDRWYWEQRAYPAGTIPIDVHRGALRRELAATRILAEGDDDEWTSLGPAPLLDFPYGLDSAQNTSGRALAIAIHPNDPNTLLLGTAQGGSGSRRIAARRGPRRANRRSPPWPSTSSATAPPMRTSSSPARASRTAARACSDRAS